RRWKAQGMWEAGTVFVDRYVVASIGKGIVHPRRDEDVWPAIRVQIADARAPGPARFDVRGIRHVAEPPLTQIGEQRVSENVVAIGRQEPAWEHGLRIVLPSFVLRRQITGHVA